MSLKDYKDGQHLELHCMNSEIGFYAVVQCAMRMADSENLKDLQKCFPGTWEDLKIRYNLPEGKLLLEVAP